MKNISYLTLRMASSGGCCGGITTPRVEYKEPVSVNQYDHYLIDNVNVYVDRFAKAEAGELKFILKNFVMLKYVDVEGIKLM